MLFNGSVTCDVWYISYGSSPGLLAFKGSWRHKELLIVWCSFHIFNHLFYFIFLTGSQSRGRRTFLYEKSHLCCVVELRKLAEKWRLVCVWIMDVL